MKNIEVIFVGNEQEIQKPFKHIYTKVNSRSSRLNLGIQQSSGEYIILHHPRSVLDVQGINFLLNLEEVSWGGFTHAFDEDTLFLKLTSWYSNAIRSKISGIIYLDHCIFIHRNLLPEKQPFVPELEIFEDTAFCKKISKKYKYPKILPYQSTTSSIRFKKNGYWLQGFLNQLLKVCYFLKVPQKTMNQIYEKGLYLNSTFNKSKSRIKK